MGELKVRMEEEMRLRGLRLRSKKSYLFAVRKFVEYHGRLPVILTRAEVGRILSRPLPGTSSLPTRHLSSPPLRFEEV
jgi:hypothetical protein